MTALAYEHRLCGVEEKEWARRAFCRISRFGVESVPIPVERAGEARLFRNPGHDRHAQARCIQGNNASFLTFSLSTQASPC